MRVAADHAAEVTATIFVILQRALCKRARAHQLVVCCEMRPLLRAPYIVRDKFPAALGQESVITTRYQSGAVFKDRSIRGLDAAPMGKHFRSCISPILAIESGTVDFVANSQLRQRQRSTVAHQNWRVTP